MKHSFSRRFFSITLFLLFCPLIFAKSEKPNQGQSFSANSAQDMKITHEVFEQLMLQARDQTQVIGFCIQQLLQTLDAGKLKITKAQKAYITEELLQIKDLTTVMLEKLFVQNSIQALNEGILINHLLIDYLLSTIQKDIKQIQSSKIHEQLAKKSSNLIPQDLIFKLAEKNTVKINKLVYTVEHVGLTWFNNIYRNLKKYNAYSITKGCCILGVSAVFAAYLLCQCDIETENKWYNKWIGQCPKENKQGSQNNPHPHYYVYKTKLSTQTGQYEKQAEILRSFTPMQKLSTLSTNLQTAGILATGALITLSYKDLFTSMYHDTFKWLYNSSTQKLNFYDKKMMGTAKANADSEGHEKVYFKDMVGCEELEQLAKKIANFIKYPERYERAQIEEHRGILLYGPPQTGKTLFAKALRTLIEDELQDKQKIPFYDAKKYYDLDCTIEEIFWFAKKNAPCIVFFDELDLMGGHRDKNPVGTSQLLTCMQGIDMGSNQVIVIGATNRPEQLDKALLVDGRFGKVIHIEYPKYENRKTFLIQQLAKRCIQLDSEYIDYIAQETDGCSYNNLKRIITEAIILSSIEMRPVTQQDFEKTLDAEVRHIQPATTMSEQERKVIATYQAGKALARHLLHTIQQVVKITINPVIKEVKPTDVALVIDSSSTKSSDNEKLVTNKKDQRVKLGEVFTKCSTTHSELLSDSEQEKECLALLAGNIALQLTMNESFAQCNKHDRAEVMQMIYGMISQGEKIDDKLKAQALVIKENFEEKVKVLLQQNQELLVKIIDILMTQGTIDRYEWKALIS